MSTQFEAHNATAHGIDDEMSDAVSKHIHVSVLGSTLLLKETHPELNENLIISFVMTKAIQAAYGLHLNLNSHATPEERMEVFLNATRATIEYLEQEEPFFNGDAKEEAESVLDAALDDILSGLNATKQ